MTNKEILAELKKCYEYLTDIQENSYEQLTKDELENLGKLSNSIDNIYFMFWNRCVVNNDMSIPKAYQSDDKETILIGASASADYTIQNNESGEFDEHITTCGDLGYYWYDDREFIERGNE